MSLGRIRQLGKTVTEVGGGLSHSAPKHVSSTPYKMTPILHSKSQGSQILKQPPNLSKMAAKLTPKFVPLSGHSHPVITNLPPPGSKKSGGSDGSGGGNHGGGGGNEPPSDCEHLKGMIQSFLLGMVVGGVLYCAQEKIEETLEEDNVSHPQGRRDAIAFLEKEYQDKPETLGHRVLTAVKSFRDVMGDYPDLLSGSIGQHYREDVKWVLDLPDTAETRALLSILETHNWNNEPHSASGMLGGMVSEMGRYKSLNDSDGPLSFGGFVQSALRCPSEEESAPFDKVSRELTETITEDFIRPDGRLDYTKIKSELTNPDGGLKPKWEALLLPSVKASQDEVD